MLSDAFVPSGIAPEPPFTVRRAGVAWRSQRWTPAALARLAAHLGERGAAALAGLGPGRLERAWEGTVGAFLDPASPERRALDPALAALCRLSRPGLEVGLEAVLGGVRGEPAAELFRRAAARHREAGSTSPVLVLLASNLPALAVQPLLPALALGRPAILKSASAEPLFAPAFAAALARREPALADAVAALAWPGGERELEAPLLAAAGRVLAYGESDTLEDLERRAPGKLVGYGPKTSLAVVSGEVEAAGELPEVARGIARDVALFDQRGCLSVVAVYTGGGEGFARRLADALAAELAAAARRWPPGPRDTATAGAVRLLRDEAEMRGLYLPELPLAEGTVVVEPRPELEPGPGLRTVRLHPLAELGRLPAILAPWRGRLQGAALAGKGARALAPALTGLGVSRCAAPGELQSPDARWHNGGFDPLDALGGGTPKGG